MFPSFLAVFAYPLASPQRQPSLAHTRTRPVAAGGAVQPPAASRCALASPALTSGAPAASWSLCLGGCRLLLQGADGILCRRGSWLQGT